MSEENELPTGWAWTTVGEIFDIVRGGTPSTSIEEYWKGDIAWISSADILDLKVIRPRKFITKAAIENSATNLVPEGSLIVVTRVGLGKVALAKMPICFSQDSQALIGDCSFLYPDYSVYFLAQAVQAFKYQSRGTTIAGVTKKQLAELPFSLSPLAEQYRIVAEIEKQFTRLDAGVAALRKAQTKLKRYRAAVLKAAVEGKLTEAWRAEHPTTEQASILLERILKERRAKWEVDLRAKGKDPAKVKYVEPAKPDVEGFPELPEGWCWATVEQIGDVGTGATPLRSRKGYYDGGTIPWVTSGALNSETIAYAEEYITKKALAETNAKVFPKGTLLLAMYGEGKTRGKVAELQIDAATNQACAAIVFRAGSKACHSYVKYFLLSNYYDIGRLSSGGVQPNLNLSKVKGTAIPVTVRKAVKLVK